MDLIGIRNKQLKYHLNLEDKLLFTLGNKPTKVAVYLLHNIDPKTNIFYFTVIGLAKKFNCSKQTVRKGIHLLDDNKRVIITNKYIRYCDDNGAIHGTTYIKKQREHEINHIKNLEEGDHNA